SIRARASRASTRPTTTRRRRARRCETATASRRRRGRTIGSNTRSASRSCMSSPDVIVYGATGLTGRLACYELDAAGVAFAIAGRDAGKLAALAVELPAATVRAAAATDPDALAGAFAGARVVLNCAGPSDVVGEPVLVAALAAGAHCVDLGGDQAF